MRAVRPVGGSSDLPDFDQDLHQVFLELDARTDTPRPAGECAPAVDVYETDHTVEVVVDLPGVPAEAVRIVAKGLGVLIAGQKAPRRSHGASSFHLVERGFGRFARIVPLTVAVDPHRARAALGDGVLRVTLPKVVERRGAGVRVPVGSARPVA